MKFHKPLLLAFATLLASPAAHAATFNVTTNTDSGAGSLRQAVLDANASAASDTITFGTAGPITLTSGNLLLVNNGTLTINGSAAGLAISGNNTSRIFDIGPNANVTLSNLTISNGNSGASLGGGIYNAGLLTIGNCTLSNNTNTAGAGGIYNIGKLDVANSTFSNNTANGGGAIVNNTVSFVAGSPDPAQFAAFRNCTFSGNNGNSNVGGALFNLNGLLSIESCTIAGNFAAIGGGISSFSGSTTLTRVQNSIIADNRTVGGGADSGIDVNFVAGDNVTNSFESGNHNVIGDGNATAKFNKTNDQTAATAAMLQLGALANNGGLTQTRALALGSNALDLGDSNETTDQRGTVRPQGGADDIGAFELATDPTGASGLVVTTLNDVVIADGLVSLREAINTANNDGGNSAITFAVNGMITLNGTALPIIVSNGAFSVTGPVAGITISGNNASGIFGNNSAVSVTLDNLTLRDVKIAANGGAIASNLGPLTILNCTFAGNSTIGSGAAIAHFGTLLVRGCAFTGNSANSGGAIYSNTSTVVAGGPDPALSTSIQNSTFTGNSATVRGGAIYNENGLTRIESSTIAGNSAPSGQGAGVATFGDTGTVTRLSNSIVADNRTTGGGADSGTDADFIGATNSVVSQGHNAIGDGNGAVGFTGAGDQVGVTAATIKLGALASNGGPTQTLALLSGSVALNTGDTVLTVDQRGSARPFGAADDIGAFESQIVINVAPSVSNIAVSVLEDTSRAFAATDFDAGFSDTSAGDALQSIRIASLPTSGTLTLSGAAAMAGQTIARADIANLIYAPAANFNGTDSFDYNASDGTLFAAITAKANITVNPVNDAPSFTIGANQTVALNATSQSVPSFATAISAGPPNESGQTLTFIVTNTNSALFSVQPAIAANGTLTYTPAPGASGVATLSVTLKDDGGTANGGVDTSAAQTFTITVTANTINFGVSIVPNGPFTRDTVKATLAVAAGSTASYSYEWFVNGTSMQNGANSKLDLSQPGFGDKGDTITVTVSASDGAGGTGTATNFAVVRNSAPFAFSGTTTAQTGIETMIPFTLFGNPGGGDSDNEALTYKRVGGPKNGTGDFVANPDGSNTLCYKPRKGFVGVEVIRFVALDETGRPSNVATLSIDVRGQELVTPSAQNAVGQTQSGVSVDVPIAGTDPNGGIVTFKRVGGPRNGTGDLMTLPDDTTVMRYIPRANFVGIEPIRFVALNHHTHTSIRAY